MLYVASVFVVLCTASDVRLMLCIASDVRSMLWIASEVFFMLPALVSDVFLMRLNRR